MATKADMDFAIHGEPEAKQHTTSEVLKFMANDEEPVVENEFVIFKLVNTKRKGGTYIPNIDDVRNPNNGNRVERVRLLAGVESIWVKDQKDLTPDYIKQNRRTLDFPRNMKIMRIPKWDQTALEYARICSYNQGGPNAKKGSQFDFFEYNSKKAQEEALAQEMVQLDMVIKAKEMPQEKMIKYASFLGVKDVDEFGEKKSPDGIRMELMLKAKQSPDNFKLLLESAVQVEMAFLIKKAISEAKLDLGRQNGSVFWANGGALICRLPATRKANEYLTELALSNTEDGIRFKDQLQTIVT